jgi:hypothetical protein
MIRRYLKDLVSEWVVTALLIADIVVFVVSSRTQSFTLPPQFYWIVAGAAFIIANYRVYARMMGKIETQDDKRAKLTVGVVQSGVSVVSPPISERGIFDDGLGDDGLPAVNVLKVLLEIENTGEEQGELEWELDLKESTIPNIFQLGDSNDRGSFDKGYGPPIVLARDRSLVQWTIDLFPTTSDPRQFAHSLSNDPRYRILLRYHTKRIGGSSPQKLIVIEGNLADYKQSVRLKWMGRKLIDLVDLVNGGPLNTQLFV